MSDLDSILDQLSTDVKVTGNLIRGASAYHESLQSCVRNQRCCTSGVGFFFVVVIVVTRGDLPGSLSLWERARVRAFSRDGWNVFFFLLRR